MWTTLTNSVKLVSALIGYLVQEKKEVWNECFLNSQNIL